jgi:hypothetical protein
LLGFLMKETHNFMEVPVSLTNDPYFIICIKKVFKRLS